MMTKFDVRYFMADSDAKLLENSTERRSFISEYMPEHAFAGSVEVACLMIKARGWIAYPFKHEDGSFSIWAWYEGLLIKLDWEIPSKKLDGVPAYDMTFLEFSPITYKKEYDFIDYHPDGYTMGAPLTNVICRKISLVNRSSPII